MTGQQTSSTISVHPDAPAVELLDLTSCVAAACVCPSDYTYLCRLDVPKAPELLGRFVGAAAAACSSSGGGGSFSLAALGELLEGAEGAEAKRGFGAAAFKAYAAAAGGQDKLAEAVKAAGLKGDALFAADEFDGDLPSVADWLKAEGFESLGL